MINSVLPTRTPENLNVIENYLYIYHIDKFIVLPSYPDSIQDTLGSTFESSTPLARSAPIFSFSSSGPRSMQIVLPFHRDMMTMLNYDVSNFNVELGDDYVDTIIKALQACALPNYKAASKMLEPPMVALRFGNEIFIKGIINGGITTTYRLPILENNKYSQVEIAFNITEIDPYDANSVLDQGSFRGLDLALEERLGIA